jgi:CheY-like chemotaxis protein
MRRICASNVLGGGRIPGVGYARWDDVSDHRRPDARHHGIELQRCIRTERPKLPVIFISAHNDDETRRRAFDEGAAAVFISRSVLEK